VSLKFDIIDKLKRIVGSSNVLTDVEDLFVYSFQGPLGIRRGSRPDAVVKAQTAEEVEKVMELAETEGIHVVRRDETASKAKHPFIMLDTTKPKNFLSLKCSLLEIKKSSITSRKSMNWLSCLRESLSDKMLNRSCKKCELSSGAACSGFCEVAPFFDYNETWSAKGRLLLVKGLLEGDLELTKKLVNIIFTCTLCGHCYAPCRLKDLEINRAIMFARYEIAKKDLLPDVFKGISTLISEQGTPYNMHLRKRTRTWWFTKLPERPKARGVEVLYWAGCTTAYRLPNIAIATINLLKKGNVDFIMLGDEEGCCGLPLVLVGLWDEAKKNAIKTVEKLRETRAQTLITGCAGCYYTFKRVFPEVLKVELPLEVMHTSQLIEQIIRDGNLEFKKLKKRVTYQDPCHLGRHCGIYEPPRNVIKAIPGIQLIDMNLNRSNGRCCGGGGELLIFNTHLAQDIAHSLLIDEVLPLKVDALITACPTCFINLKYTSRLKKIRIPIYDLVEFVDKARKE